MQDTFSTCDAEERCALCSRCLLTLSAFLLKSRTFLLQPSVNWVVPMSEKVRYDDIFVKTDTDMDGFVSGQEVKDIFMHSGLSQNLLAHIW